MQNNPAGWRYICRNMKQGFAAVIGRSFSFGPSAKDDIEDIFQDSCIILMQKIKSGKFILSREGAIFSCLVQIGKLTACNFIRKRRPLTPKVEISLTDGVVLGIRPPVRLSGDSRNSPGCTLTGPEGSLTLPEGVICAQRHIHMTPEDGARLGIRDGDAVKLKVYSKRPVIFEQVPVRISGDFQTRVHLDFDEANACGFQNGDLGRILQ